MKLKRIAIFIIAATILCASVLSVCAQTPPAPTGKMIRYEPYVDGWRSYQGEIQYGESLTMELRDLTLDGEPADASEFTFKWYEGIQNESNVIAGETSSSLTVSPKKSQIYTCVVSADDAITASMNFSVLVDTITNKLTCTNPVNEEESDDIFFAIEDCKIGQDITFTLNSTSKTGAPVTYSWRKYDENRQFIGDVLSTTNTLTVNKDVKGFVEYGCTVSDGTYSEDLIFRMLPVNTLTETIKLGGVTPERFERGYMIVAKAGEKVDLTVKVETTNQNFTRRWERIDWTPAGPPQVSDFGTAETITVIKRDMPDDDYDFEMFECYLDDGNEVFSVGIVLFGLHPYQVTQESDIKKGTPEVSLDDSTEALANSLLQKDMEKLSGGKNAKITLSAEEIDKLDKSEQAAIEKVLPENSEIGTCIDINLYKQIDGEDKDQITETAGEINLSIEVPKEMLDGNSQTKFTVTRMHEGKAENLDCVYDEETKTVSFKTDKFSTYVLSTVAPKASGDKSPATGDSATCAAVALAGMLAVAYTFRKCTIKC